MVICVPNLKSQTVWSEVNIGAAQVYVNEPVEVTISVYTSTWFTQGIDPGNIKVNGAFTTYFRPLSSSITKNGKTYASVQLFYHVFPYQEKDVEFPALNIEVETPPEGGFKGVKKVLKTAPKVIKVKPVPPGFDKSGWLVADNVSVTDQWQNNLKQVKVGDVLTRNIQIGVDGTVAELIPPLKWDSISGVSQYPSRSEVENQKGKTTISASRTETMRFLLEKEGEVMIPEMVIRWYNAKQKRMYKRTLKAVELEIRPNPDLGLLESIKDSMQVAQKQVDEAEVQPFSVFGLSLRNAIAMLILVIVFVVLIVRFMPKYVGYLKLKKQKYRQSEPYFFKQFIAAVQHKESKNITNSLYRWLDQLHIREPNMRHFIKKYGSDELWRDVAAIESNGHADINIQVKEWKNARRNYLQQKVGKIHDGNWINP